MPSSSQFKFRISSLRYYSSFDSNWRKTDCAMLSSPHRDLGIWSNRSITTKHRTHIQYMSFLAGIFFILLYLSLHHYCLSTQYIQSHNRFLLRRTPVSIFTRPLLHVCEWLLSSLLLLLLVCRFVNRHTLAPSRSTDEVYYCARARFYFDFLSHKYIRYRVHFKTLRSQICATDY